MKHVLSCAFNIASSSALLVVSACLVFRLAPLVPHALHVVASEVPAALRASASAAPRPGQRPYQPR